MTTHDEWLARLAAEAAAQKPNPELEAELAEVMRNAALNRARRAARARRKAAEAETAQTREEPDHGPH